MVIVQREVPPLTVEGLETVPHHGLAQHHAVGKLLGSDGAPLRRSRLRQAAEKEDGGVHPTMIFFHN